MTEDFGGRIEPAKHGFDFSVFHHFSFLRFPHLARAALRASCLRCSAVSKAILARPALRTLPRPISRITSEICALETGAIPEY